MNRIDLYLIVSAESFQINNREYICYGKCTRELPGYQESKWLTKISNTLARRRYNSTFMRRISDITHNVIKSYDMVNVYLCGNSSMTSQLYNAIRDIDVPKYILKTNKSGNQGLYEALLILES